MGRALRRIVALVCLTVVITGCGPTKTTPAANPDAANLGAGQPAAGASGHEPAPTAGETAGSQGATPPAPPAGEGRPADSGCLTRSPEGPYGEASVGQWASNYSLWARGSICSGSIDESPVTIRFVLTTALDRPAAERLISIQAAQPPQFTFSAQASGTEVELAFPAGHAGEVVAVELAGPVGAGGAAERIGFRLSRRANPQVLADVRSGEGAWQPLDASVVLPRQPLALRFRLIGGPDAKAVRHAIEQALGKTEAKVEEPSATEFLVTVPAPPIRLEFFFRGVPGPTGNVQGGTYTIFTGQPPVLVAVDPVTGQEEPVGPAPVDLDFATPSPDGRWELLFAGADRQAWLLDTRSGRFWPLAFRLEPYGNGLAWAPGRLVLAGPQRILLWDLDLARGEEVAVPGTQWLLSAGDGRYLVGYYVSWFKDENWRAPATLVLFDTQRKTYQTLPDLVRILEGGKGQYPPLHAGLTPEGDAIIVGDETGLKLAERGFSRFWRVDLATGRVTPDPGPIPESVPTSSPTGRTGPIGWSYGSSGWGKVTVVDPTGASHVWGTGLIAGWRADGRLLVVRWPDEQYRRQPPPGE